MYNNLYTARTNFSFYLNKIRVSPKQKFKLYIKKKRTLRDVT